MKFYKILSLLSLCSVALTTLEKTNIELDNLVIMVGLPKSGLASIHTGLTNLGIKSAHWEVPNSICNKKYPVSVVTVGTAGMFLAL